MARENRGPRQAKKEQVTPSFDRAAQCKYTYLRFQLNLEELNMARDKSAVLSPADRKAVVTDVKAKIKVVKDGLKANEKAFKESEKTHNNTVKTLTKDNAALTKTLGKLEGELAALQPAIK
jgi:hypothetical protein